MGVVVSKRSVKRTICDTSFTAELVTALAQAEGCEPTELEYTLYEFISPEVLEALAAEEDTPWTFTFRVSDHQVRLTSDGQIFVYGVQYRGDRKVFE